MELNQTRSAYETEPGPAVPLCCTLYSRVRAEFYALVASPWRSRIAYSMSIGVGLLPCDGHLSESNRTLALGAPADGYSLFRELAIAHFIAPAVKALLHERWIMYNKVPLASQATSLNARLVSDFEFLRSNDHLNRLLD